jgi:hypothetical protein
MARTASPVSGILKRVQKLTAQTAEGLKRELAWISKEKAALTAGLDEAAERIHNTLSRLGHGLTSRREATPRQPRTQKSRTRIRRSPEQLKHEAEAIFQLVKAKGNDGVAGGEIRKHYPKVGPDIKGFVQKHGKQKLKTTGKKASTRYVAS